MLCENVFKLNFLNFLIQQLQAETLFKCCVIKIYCHEFIKDETKKKLQIIHVTFGRENVNVILG